MEGIQMFGTEAKLERFVWSHQTMKVPVSYPQIALGR